MQPEIQIADTSDSSRQGSVRQGSIQPAGQGSIQVVSPSRAAYQQQQQAVAVQGVSYVGSDESETATPEGDAEDSIVMQDSHNQEEIMEQPRRTRTGKSRGGGHVRFNSGEVGGRSRSPPEHSGSYHRGGEGRQRKYAPAPTANIILLDDPDLYRPAPAILNWQGPKRSLKPPKLQLWLFIALLQTIQMVVLATVPEALPLEHKTTFVAIWIAVCAIFGVTVLYMSTTRHLHQIHALMDSINTPLDMDLVIERLQMGRFSRFEETWKIQVGIVKMFCRLLKHHHGVHPVSGQQMNVNAGWSREVQQRGGGGGNGGRRARGAQEGARVPTILSPGDDHELQTENSFENVRTTSNNEIGGDVHSPTLPDARGVLCSPRPERGRIVTGSELFFDDDLFSLADSDEEAGYQSGEGGMMVERMGTKEFELERQRPGSPHDAGAGGFGEQSMNVRSLSGSCLSPVPGEGRLERQNSRNSLASNTPSMTPTMKNINDDGSGVYRPSSPVRPPHHGGRRRSKAVALDGDPLEDNELDWDSALGPETDHNKNRGLMLQVLKNAKMGTDLSKTPLPVDILEPRSLLEKLSDLFVHPQIFGAIGEESDAALRAVAVQRWLVSGFHVRPKGPRKPYNPILGETFECSFAAGTSEEIRYVAEQVSHHPPASNFTAKHMRTGVTVIASFWPRGKLLTPNTGASVGDGRITVSVPSQNDSYEMSWPSVHCSGLLKAPSRIEVCGDVDVISLNSGIKGVIQFVPKGWFGGAYDTIKGNVCLATNPKVPLFTIAGVWHEETTVTPMVLDEEGRNTAGEPEILFSASAAPAMRPMVGETYFKKPSRAIWTPVTVALRGKDAKEAQKAKEELEANERTVRRAREARGEEYLPQLFRMVDRPKKPAKATWQFVGPALGSTAEISSVPNSRPTTPGSFSLPPSSLGSRNNFKFPPGDHK